MHSSISPSFKIPLSFKYFIIASIPPCLLRSDIVSLGMSEVSKTAFSPFSKYNLKSSSPTLGVFSSKTLCKTRIMCLFDEDQTSCGILVFIIMNGTSSLPTRIPLLTPEIPSPVSTPPKPLKKSSGTPTLSTLYFAKLLVLN